MTTLANATQPAELDVTDMIGRGVARITFWSCAVLFFVSIGLTLTRDPIMGGLIAVTTVALMVMSRSQLRRDHPDATPLLWTAGFLTTGIFVVSYATGDIAGAQGRGGIGVLVVLGTADLLLSRRRTTIRTLGWCALSTIALLIGNIATGRAVELVATDVAVLLVAVLGGAKIMHTIRTALVERTNRYSSVVNLAPVGILEVDLRRVVARLARIRSAGITDIDEWLGRDSNRLVAISALIEQRHVNSAAANILKLPSGVDEFEHLSMEGSLEPIRQLVVAVWTGQDGAAAESQIRDENGALRTVVFHWGRRRVDGVPDDEHWVVTVVDVEEQKRAERALHAQIEQRDRFVATVSHELRTPLSAVVGLTRELADRMENFSQEEVQELLDLVSSQSTDVAHIVDDLLVAARADTGSITIAPAAFDVLPVIEELTEEDPVDPKLSVDPGIEAWCDPLRFRQIIRNLLTNAGRYGGPLVKVTARQGSDVTSIEVRDDGYPVPPEKRHAMFEAYERAHDEDQGITGSVGLGLSVARQLAELMGGSLTYDHDGVDSIFRLDVPRRAPEPEGPDEQATAQVGTARS